MSLASPPISHRCLANRFVAVWIVTGPVFVDHFPIARIGDWSARCRRRAQGAVQDPNPRDGRSGRSVRAQISPDYTRRPFDHTRFLTTIAEIEELTV